MSGEKRYDKKQECGMDRAGSNTFENTTISGRATVHQGNTYTKNVYNHGDVHLHVGIDPRHLVVVYNIARIAEAIYDLQQAGPSLIAADLGEEPYYPTPEVRSTAIQSLTDLVRIHKDLRREELLPQGFEGNTIVCLRGIGPTRKLTCATELQITCT